MGRSPTQLGGQPGSEPVVPLGQKAPWAVGGLVGALVLFALGLGVSSAVVERRAVTDGESAVATVPMVGGVLAASSGAKATSAVVGEMWTLVAIELVSIVAALTTVVAPARRGGSSWLRAPPVVIA